MTFRPLALAAAAVLLLSRLLAAQDVRLSGGDDSPAARLARDIVARGNYLRLDRDTVLPATFHATGDVVVYDADVRLEGTIDGDVAVVGGNFFIRPRAVVKGQIALVGGDVYTSALASTGRVLETRPGSRVAMPGDSAMDDSSAYAVRIVPRPPAPLFAISTTALPGYDRVNGVTVVAGARILPTRNDSGPKVDLWAAYRFENPDKPGGGARVTLPLGVQSLELQAEAFRYTRTNDAWQRGTLSNSISVLTTGRDYRNYYDADVGRVMLSRPVGKPLVAGESWLNPRVGMQWEQARSLRTRHVFSIWESNDKDRVNPPVLDGTLVSAFAGAEIRIVGARSQLVADAQVERAIPGWSDAGFTQLVGDATYTATAFRTHTLSVYLRGATTLASDAPPQRYAILGGPATIATERIAHFRGDHLAFVDARYGIPLPLQVPFVGQPSLMAAYVAGAAWTGSHSPPWTQNLGAGVAFRFASAILYADPRLDIGKSRLIVTAAIPRVF